MSPLRFPGWPWTASTRRQPSFSGLVVLSAVVLVVWAVAKRALFLRGAYTSDLFSLLQMSDSWLLGKPLLFDARYGSQWPIHHYLLLPLLGPVTLWFGAYGVFGIYLLSLFGAICLLLSEMRRLSVGFSAALVVLGLVVGPIGYWIFDDQSYGLHGEIFFMPLVLVYVVGIVRRARWRWVVLALLCLTREEGPIVAFSAHLLTVLLPVEGDAVSFRARWTSALRLIPWYAALMMVGMLPFLLGSSPGPMLPQAIRNIRALPFSVAMRSFVFVSLRAWAGLMAPIFVASLYFDRRWRVAGFLIVAMLPLLAMTSVGAIVYPDTVHNAAWPPRFVLTWATGNAAVFLCAVSSKRTREFDRLSAMAVGIVILQVWLLLVARDYSATKRLFERGQFLGDRLTTSESRFVGCLASVLPVKSDVASTGDFFAAFHRQQVVWPDFVQNIGGIPDIVVCETKGRAAGEYGCQALLERERKRDFKAYAVQGVTVAYPLSMDSYISSCRVSEGRELIPPEVGTPPPEGSLH